MQVCVAGVCVQVCVCVDIIQELYTGTGFHVRTADSVSEDFQVKTRVRQGCVLSPWNIVQLCHRQGSEGSD